MTRIWAYDQMQSDAALALLVGDRVYQSTSLDAAPHEKPFIMYRQTSDVSVFRGDDGEEIRQKGYMIFAHDIPGDYLRIDAVMTELKRLFADTVDQANGIVRSKWDEISDDQRDEDMGTIIQFARIRVIYKA